MRLIDAIKQTGKPFIVHESRRDELPEFFKELGFREGVEIGVNKADFTTKFCEVGLVMSAVDPWLAFKGQGRTQNVQENQELNYNIAKKALSPYHNCRILRTTSMDALRYFAKESLDFVYIDGDHTLIPVIQDILKWSRKVRTGGVVAGHDYYCTGHWARNVVCQVKPAVDACIEILGIKNFYLFGKIENARYSADRVYSWMWIKE
jgi:hypothetical protein